MSIIGLTQIFGGPNSIFVTKYLKYLILTHNIKEFLKIWEAQALL